jgi:enoyl-CoA hydratase/carnithine racemase
VPAKEALAMGLFDELVEEGKLRAGAIAFANKVLAENRPLNKVRDLNAKVEAAAASPRSSTPSARPTPQVPRLPWPPRTTSSASRRR